MVKFNIAIMTVLTLSFSCFSNANSASDYNVLDRAIDSQVDFEHLPEEKAGYQCYWMENHSGEFRWIPAEQGFLYSGKGGIRECYVLDSCNGGLGYSGGGCYKWASSPYARRVDWGTSQTMVVNLKKNGDFKVLLSDKHFCPATYNLVTFDEATEISSKVCEQLANSWQIIRLAGGASMDGASYDCKVRRYDERALGHMLCKKALYSH